MQVSLESLITFFTNFNLLGSCILIQITNNDNPTFNQSITLHSETCVQDKQPKTSLIKNNQPEATMNKAKGKKGRYSHSLDGYQTEKLRVHYTP